MKHNPKSLVSFCFLTLSAPSLVLAAAPLAFDGWTTNASGTVDATASCTSKPNVTCRTLSSDAGFLQQEVKTPDYTYIRVIVTDPTGAGGPSGKDFTAESFVPFALDVAGFSQGVAAKQVVRDVAEGFTDQAEIQSAMMRFSNPGITNLATQPSSPTLAADMFKVRLTQTFDKPDYKSSFKYTNYTAFSQGGFEVDSNNVIGHTLEMSQTIPIPNAPTANAKQLFVHEQAGGYAGNSASVPFPSNYLISAPITTAGSATLNGKQISWTTGETVSTSWIAENTSGTATTAQAFSNTTDGSPRKDSSSLTITNAPTPTAPTVWPAIFGTAPSFP